MVDEKETSDGSGSLGPDFDEDFWPEDEQYDERYQSYIEAMDLEDENAHKMSNGFCPNCGAHVTYSIVEGTYVCDPIIDLGSAARDIDDLDEWSRSEIEKMDQGWNPIQDFGHTYKCAQCGYSAHETCIDVSY